MINLYQIYYFCVMGDNEENESEHNIEKEDIEVLTEILLKLS